MDITVKNLTKSFGDKRVLDGFDAVFAEGFRTCVMGESGCGKTTLVNILLGLLQPDGGTVEGVPEKKSAVFQEDRLCEDFSAVSNVRLVSKKLTRADAESALTALGLADSMYKPVRELSGGMKRRTAVARALLADCELVIMDEPFKGLDEETRRKTARYVVDMTAGKTLIVITHDAEEAAMLGADIIKMRKTT